MKATKLVIGTSMLIAVFAVGLAPTAAAEGVTECTPPEYGVGNPGPNNDIDECVSQHEEDCTMAFPDDDEIAQRLACILLG